MKKDLTEIVFILDRSGSMAGLENDTIGGFNAMIDKMKRQNGMAVVSTVLFDSRTEVIHDRVDIESISPLTSREYYVRGSTALLDAIGGAIDHIVRVRRHTDPSKAPEHTIFVITTDGMENASVKYRADQVRRKISIEKEKYGWEFLFLGANIDAVKTAGKYGISRDRAVNYNNDSEGIRLNYKVVAQAVGSVRGGFELDENWKESIEDDYRIRGRHRAQSR